MMKYGFVILTLGFLSLQCALQPDLQFEDQPGGLESGFSVEPSRFSPEWYKALEIARTKKDREWALKHALFDGVREGDVQKIRKALQDGVDINADNGFGHNALRLMLERPNIHVAETLLKNGAFLEPRNANDETMQYLDWLRKEWLRTDRRVGEIGYNIPEKNRLATLNRFDIIKEIFASYKKLVDEAQTEPNKVIKEAVRLGLVDLTQQILNGSQLSVQELTELNKLTAGQYLKTKDISYENIMILLQAKMKSIRGQC